MMRLSLCPEMKFSQQKGGKGSSSDRSGSGPIISSIKIKQFSHLMVGNEAFSAGQTPIAVSLWCHTGRVGVEVVCNEAS